MKDPYKLSDKIVYDSASGSTFKEAFADARKEALKGGSKTFEWNGKKYGTALKGETTAKPQASSASKPQASSASQPQASSMIDAGTAAGLASTGRTRARPEDYEKDEYKAGRFENKMNRSIGRTTDPENAAKIQNYNETRKNDAAVRATLAKETEAGRTTDIGTMLRNKMPVDGMGEMGEFRKGGKVKKMASGGMTKSASSRGDGIAQRGKTRGKMC